MLETMGELRTLINNIAILGKDIVAMTKNEPDKGVKRKKNESVAIFNLASCRDGSAKINELEFTTLFERFSQLDKDVKFGVLIFSDNTLKTNFKQLEDALKKFSNINASKLVFHIRNKLVQPSDRLGKVLSHINKLQSRGKFLAFISLFLKRDHNPKNLVDETSMNLLTSLLFYTFKKNISIDTYLLSLEHIFIPRIATFNVDLAYVTPFEVEDAIEKERPFRNLIGNLSMSMEAKSKYLSKLILKMDEASLAMKKYFKNIYNIFISNNIKNSHNDILSIYSYKIPGKEIKLPN
ncbi:MAG: hypothetical protein ACP6IP_00905 [Candidatus Njordarchaeia archaeon]